MMTTAFRRGHGKVEGQLSRLVGGSYVAFAAFRTATARVEDGGEAARSFCILHLSCVPFQLSIWGF